MPLKVNTAIRRPGIFVILNALPSLKVFANIQELNAYLDAMQAGSHLKQEEV